MKKIRTRTILLVCIICVLFSGVASAGNEATEESKVDFNCGWTFVKSKAESPDDFEKENKAMGAVLLPHTWNADDMVVGSNAPYKGVAWYRKPFEVPLLEKGQRLLLEFEGVNNCYKVWVNGGYAGGRDGGFLSTLLDITDFVEEGGNTVLVRVDSRFEITAAIPEHIDWNRYGGITRPVWMHVREHAYLTLDGVEIRTPEVSKESASTLVQVHVQEESLSGSRLQIRHILKDPHGDIISTRSNSLITAYSRINTIETSLPPLAFPELWSDQQPTLYTLTTELIEGGIVIDRREDRIGYRFFHFDADKGFILNGKPTQLRGANIHIFFPGLGNAVPERFHRSEMQLMKQMGCNFMRASHYPRHKECLEICDELGIMVMEEQPYWHGSLRARHGETAIDNAPRLIKDMVRQHRNHPSIIAWNTVNEVMLAPFFRPGGGHLQPNDPRRAKWMINTNEYPYIRRHLQKMVDAFKEADPDRPVSMVVGGAWRINDIAHLTSVADIVGYNGGAMRFEGDFFDPVTQKKFDFQPEYYRELYPQRIHMMTEGVLNIFCYERGEWKQEEEAWRRSAECWDKMGRYPWFCGGSMWCFTDYSANGLLNLHGVVDRYRLKKDLFYFYQAMWSDQPVLHILGHWNHETGDSKDIVVFTNCGDVELILNGKSLGNGIPCSEEYPAIANPPLIWKNVNFKKGKLEANGIYDNQRLVDTRITSGNPAKIVLSATNDLIANGRDISYVELTLCDKEGNRCYTANHEVKLEISGPAKLAGSEVITVVAGQARVAIRSSGMPGEIAISARSENFGKEEINLRAIKK